MAVALAGRRRPPFSRALGRLLNPIAYFATLGGIQIGLLWTFRGGLGLWLPGLATIGWLVLLAVLLVVRGRWRVKQGLLFGLIAVSGLGPTMLGIIQRPQLGLTIEHDGLIQTEAAIDRLMEGQPIYGVDWSNTAITQMPWGLTGPPNPALHHLAYFPLTILVGVPVRALTGWMGLPFDGRIVLILMSLIALIAIAALRVEPQRRFMIATAVFMSPLITLYLWSGRNDVEFLAFVFVSLALLSRNRPVAASVALGSAIAFKPFALFAAPFLLLALAARWRQRPSRREILLSLLALGAVPVLTIAPFLLANPRALLIDTVAYTSGGIPDAYPLGGYGFAALLLALHLLARNSDAFPFAFIQLPAMAVAMWFAGRRFLYRPTLGNWMAGYTGLFFAFAFFARFFNDNYLGVVLTLALCVPPLGDSVMQPAAAEEPGELAA